MQNYGKFRKILTAGEHINLRVSNYQYSYWAPGLMRNKTQKKLIIHP